jgi:hypothetical protein
MPRNLNLFSLPFTVFLRVSVCVCVFLYVCVCECVSA